MKKFALVQILLLLTVSAFSRILHVPADYSTIQKAVYASNINDDTILVSPGTYSQFVAIGKSLVIASLYLTTGDTSYISQTILTGTLSNRAVKLESYGSDLPMTLTGFTIQNGHAPSNNGGGIYIAYCKVTLSHLKVKDNYSGKNGGGIYIKDSDVTINHCEFTGNKATQPTSNNRDEIYKGGAIAIRSSVPHTFTVNHSSFTNNKAFYGGAIYDLHGFGGQTKCRFYDCNFDDNEARMYAGAIYIIGDSAFVERCSFQNNISYTGGAVMVYPYSYLKVENCLIAGNRGGLELASNKAIISNTTITDNGCIHKPIYINYSSAVYFFNSIAWNICGKEFEMNYDNRLYVSHSTIQHDTNSVLITDIDNSVYWGDSISGLWPVFKGWYDYHLKPESPCIGAGVDSVKMNGFWFNAPQVDIDDSLRPGPAGTNPDVGAYENSRGLPVSINESKAVANFTIYPNPSTGAVSFHNNTGLPVDDLIIYDLSGRKVAHHSKVYGDINISGLPKGMYLVVFKTKKETAKQKLVVNY